MNFLKDRVVLITGGTGSFGQKFVDLLLESTPVKTVRIYSRDEHKQLDMADRLSCQKDRLRFFLGDIRDEAKLRMALRGVDYVVHAAAYKQVQKAELDPLETVKTNIQGTQNVINAALDNDVSSVLLVSTDKAVQPINLYGSTKMVAERLTIAANAYRGNRRTRFCATRYGNVAGSRSTIVPIFLNQAPTGKVTITDTEATRFWIPLRESNKFVLQALEMAAYGQGGEIYVPKMPSVRVVDVATAVAPEAQQVVIGQRPGDKLHESLLTEEEALRSFSRPLRGFIPSVYVIQPQSPIWPYTPTFDLTGRPKQFTSDDNTFLSVEEIRDTIKEQLGLYESRQ